MSLFFTSMYCRPSDALFFFFFFLFFVSMCVPSHTHRGDLGMTEDEMIAEAIARSMRE
jgi:hypothetical protein